MRYVVVLALVLGLLAGCQADPKPTPSGEPTPAVSASASPTETPVPTPETTPEPSVEPTPETTPEVTPVPTPEPTPIPPIKPVQFVGEGSVVTDPFTLPAATFAVTLEALAVDGAQKCSIDVSLVSEDGVRIAVGAVDSDTRKTVVSVDAPAGMYRLDIDDPDCAWVVNIKQSE